MNIVLLCLLAVSAVFTLNASADPGSSERPTKTAFGPWFWDARGGAVHKFGADVDGGGEVSSSRAFVQGGFGYAWDRQTSVSLSLGAGSTRYDFSSDASIEGSNPWGDVHEYRLAVPMRFAPTERSNVIVIPSVRTNLEQGASLSSGRTEGLIAGISWRLSDGFAIGPGFGWFNDLGDEQTAFPIVLVDWDITPQLNLGTGGGLAASRGPGLTLSYSLSSQWDIALSGRYEQVRFALDSGRSDVAAIGEEASVPVVLTATYTPWPMTSVSVLAGVEFNGGFRLEDAGGRLISETDFDTTPVIGLTFSSRF